MTLRRLTDDRGMTLIEALVSMTIVMFVFGATLTAFDALQDNNRATEAHNEAQDQVRVTTDRMARELRNLASPTDLPDPTAARPNAVERAEEFDLIFRTVDEVKPAGTLNDPNVMRVRYCLDRADAQQGVLRVMSQRWTDAVAPPMPTATECTANTAGWSEHGVVGTAITNGGRPVFSYNAAVLPEITRVRTDMYVDPDPLKAPRESRLSTAVLLRNQNQFPDAAFDATLLNSTTNTWRLDASGSRDAEGQTLTYQWYLDPPSPPPNCDVTPTPASCIGDGIVLAISLPDAGAHTIGLAVSDPAGLTDYEARTLN